MSRPTQTDGGFLRPSSPPSCRRRPWRWRQRQRCGGGSGAAPEMATHELNSQPVHPATYHRLQYMNVCWRPANDGSSVIAARSRSVPSRCALAVGSPIPIVRRRTNFVHALRHRHKSPHDLQAQADQKGRARLFRRPRHLDHPQVAAADLRRRGGDLHRRSRPGRRARAGAREGADARHQAGEHLHRGPARGVRARLRVPDVPRQRAVRGRLPARHLDRPAADRQEADRHRARDRRRRRLPRRHRQGQRPGALRALAITRWSRTSRSSRRGASGSSRAART